MIELVHKCWVEHSSAHAGKQSAFSGRSALYRTFLEIVSYVRVRRNFSQLGNLQRGEATVFVDTQLLYSLSLRCQ